MPLKFIFSYLTYPGKNKESAPDVSGTSIPITTGRLLDMLKQIYESAEKDCDIPISFLSEAGVQKNAIRDNILKLIKKPSLESALPLANQLQLATGGTSRMGLLFLCIGEEGGEAKIVISRFPADEGIVAEKNSNELTVQFVEQVFLKSAFSYKAAVYRGDPSDNTFWAGFAVDKQINSGKHMADYWVTDFLRSDFKTTGATGTKRLAFALRDAIAQAVSSEIKHDIASAVRLSGNIKKTAMSIEEFCNDFHLSDDSKAAVLDAVTPARLIKEKFRFDAKEFNKHIAYKLVELDNGAVLSAQVEKFDLCFETRSTGKKGEFNFKTSGKIVNEKLKATR